MLNLNKNYVYLKRISRSVFQGNGKNVRVFETLQAFDSHAIWMYLARFCNKGHEILHVHSQTYCLAVCQVSARSFQKQRRNPLLFSLRKYRFSKQKSPRLSGKSHFIAEAWHWSQKKPCTP